RCLGRIRSVMPASALLRTRISEEARGERPIKFANSIRAFRSLIGLLQTQAPNCIHMKGGSFPPPSSGLSALHGEACQALFLEAIAHGHRIIAVAKSDKTGTVESL